jgi:hypothetical protein
MDELAVRVIVRAVLDAGVGAAGAAGDDLSVVNFATALFEEATASVVAIAYW